MCGEAASTPEGVLEGVEAAVAAIRVNRRKVRMMGSSLCVHDDVGTERVPVTLIRNRTWASSPPSGMGSAVLAQGLLRSAQRQPLPAAALQLQAAHIPRVFHPPGPRAQRHIGRDLSTIGAGHDYELSAFA